MKIENIVIESIFLNAVYHMHADEYSWDLNYDAEACIIHDMPFQYQVMKHCIGEVKKGSQNTLYMYINLLCKLVILTCSIIKVVKSF